MTPKDLHLPAPETINECTLRFEEPSLAHSKGKPNAPPTRTNTNIRFATPLIEEMHVRPLGTEAGWLRPAWAGPLATWPFFL
jgi:hypothetical protein